MSKKEKKQKKNSLGIILGICIIFIVLLIAAIGVLFFKLNTKEAVSQGNGNYVIDESNLMEIEEQLTSSVDDGMFEVNMNTTWRFEAGNPVSTNAFVANGGSNRYPVTIEVILEDGGTIYTSSLIPVGNQLKEIKLEKPLEKGTYNGICTYHLWKEDGEERSSMGVNITLVVE